MYIILKIKINVQEYYKKKTFRDTYPFPTRFHSLGLRKNECFNFIVIVKANEF